MRRRLTKAITVGLGLAGCTTRAIPGGSEDGTGGAQTSNAEDDDSGVSLSTQVATTQTTDDGDDDDAEADVDDGDADAEAESNADDADDGNPHFDVGGPRLDFGGSNLDCNLDQEPPLTLGVPCEVVEYQLETWVMICAPFGDDGCVAPNTFEVEQALMLCFDPSGEASCYGLYNSCGPIQDGDEGCCYWGTVGQLCPGRPLLVDGAARIASLVARDDWADAWPVAPRTSIDDLVARAWLFDAQHEHAAIASFARFAIQLLAIGAPPRFVEGAVRAASDEREHATLFFGLAQAHGGRALGPGPLDTTGVLGSTDVIAIVVATVREGCIAESISAMQLARAQTYATDPALRDALARVVAQELEHVELAWSFVAWAYARGDARLRGAVTEAFASAWDSVPKASDVEPHPSDAGKWRARGRLTHDERAAIAVSTLRTIVEPTARELFGRVSSATVGSACA
jgi:hypothetical protein